MTCVLREQPDQLASQRLASGFKGDPDRRGYTAALSRTGRLRRHGCPMRPRNLEIEVVESRHAKPNEHRFVQRVEQSFNTRRQDIGDAITPDRDDVTRLEPASHRSIPSGDHFPEDPLLERGHGRPATGSQLRHIAPPGSLRRLSFPRAAPFAGATCTGDGQ